MSEPRSGQANLAWLQVVLAAVAAVALVLLYFLLSAISQKPTLVQLLLNLIPNLLSVLLAVVILYFILTRRGIPWLQNMETDEMKRLAPVIDEASQQKLGVSAFYSNFRLIPWAELLRDARSIDISVCYWDSWVKANWEPLTKFFARGGSMRIFLPDPREADVLGVVCQRFPEHPNETLKFKIVNTGLRLYEALQASGSKSARLETYFFSQSLNYSAVRFDGRQVLLSVYEQFREERIDSSAVLINLSADQHLLDYWDKEFGGFVRFSVHMPHDELRRMASDIRGS